MKTPKPLAAAEARRLARASKRFESIDAEVQRQVAATLKLRRVPTKRERLEKLEEETEDLKARIAELNELASSLITRVDLIEGWDP